MNNLLIFLHFVLFTASFTFNNVCRNLEDYRTIQTNTNCWHNPDVEASPKEIAEKYGFPFESHEVQTSDGYFLNLFRIPGDGRHPTKSIVFLQHGIAVDGLTWMMLASKSIAFVFARSGYDVWISNCRGNMYSYKHTRFNPSNPKYWNFSFHEIGVYDVPAMLYYIKNYTNSESKIIYIGHSMGTTVSYIYASLYPNHARKHLKKIFSIAPVAYMDNVNSLARVVAPLHHLLWRLVQLVGFYGIGQNFKGPLNNIQNLCMQYPYILICNKLMDLLAGVNKNETVMSNLPLILRHFPSGLSFKTALHFTQIMASRNRFQFFDYGQVINQKYYNSTAPPEYPVEKISVPVYLFYGRSDLLSAEKDVYFLFNKLRCRKHIQEVMNFAHLDFVFGEHALDFYKHLLKFF